MEMHAQQQEPFLASAVISVGSVCQLLAYRPVNYTTHPNTYERAEANITCPSHNAGQKIRGTLSNDHSVDTVLYFGYGT
jgi:hypothetical protein